MRVLEPMALDFGALADGVVRNNVGVGGIQVEVQARCEGERVIIDATDQEFALQGAAPPAGWARFDVLHWDTPERLALRAVR